MRDYLLVTRGVDPVELERGRMAQMQVGYQADGKDALDVMAYVSFQELATRISHRNTGKYTEDPIADKLLARVAARREPAHGLLPRPDHQGARADPSQTVVSIANEVLGFEMPGTGIADFGRKAAQMARAGIYDLRIHHDQVLKPLLTHWGYFELEGLDAEAEQARTAVGEHLEAIDGFAGSGGEDRCARGPQGRRPGRLGLTPPPAAATRRSRPRRRDCLRRSERQVLQHLGDQRRDRRALATGSASRARTAGGP